eukprot:1701259-Pyramimonas_sp.AAC.1
MEGGEFWNGVEAANCGSSADGEPCRVARGLVGEDGRHGGGGDPHVTGGIAPVRDGDQPAASHDWPPPGAPPARPPAGHAGGPLSCGVPLGGEEERPAAQQRARGGGAGVGKRRRNGDVSGHAG